MIKTLFRREYGVKLFCVEGFSEDDDDSPYTAMMEQMMGIIASFYSRNLSSEVRRGIVYRHERGLFHGDRGPLGYILATEKTPKRHRAVKATDEMPPGLHVVPREAAIVRRAFRLYATGEYSYQGIADYLNSKAKYLNLGDAKITVSWVREMLINRLYLGEVSYSEVIYKDGFRKSKKSHRGRRAWRPGIHQAIITPELFDACQRVREKRAPKRGGNAQKNHYLLSGKLWCGHCLEKRIATLDDKNYGRMHCQSHTRSNGRQRRYHCVSHRRGYERCSQKIVNCEVIDAQVIEALIQVSAEMPADIESSVNEAMRQRAEIAAQLDRMEQIQEVIKRIDLSWENGFMSEDEYLNKRRNLQYQLDALTPIDYEDLREKSFALKSFTSRWREAKDRDEQALIIDGLVKAVVVKGDVVTAIVLYGDATLVSGANGYFLGSRGERMEAVKVIVNDE
jgi:hypothetical protein